MHGPVVGLEAAADPQKSLLRHNEPVALEKLRRENRVRHAGLILKTHKDDALSGSRQLAADDETANFNTASIPEIVQCRRRNDVGHGRTDEGHGMRARGESRPGPDRKSTRLNSSHT